MKLSIGKLVLIATIFFSYSLYASNQLVQIINTIDHGQVYCPVTTPTNVQTYLKQIMPNSVRFCLGAKENQINYQNDFKNLLVQAKDDPKKYAYYVGLAYSLGLGVTPDLEESRDWLLKAELAGNFKAQYAFAIMAIQGGSPICNEYAEKCTQIIEKQLIKLDTTEGYETLISLSSNQQKRCQYAQKAVNLGSSSAYPVYVYCRTEVDKEPLSKEMRAKLKEILDDKSSAIITKMVAASLLDNTYAYNMLSQAVQ